MRAKAVQLRPSGFELAYSSTPQPTSTPSSPSWSSRHCPAGTSYKVCDSSFARTPPVKRHLRCLSKAQIGGVQETPFYPTIEPRSASIKSFWREKIFAALHCDEPNIDQLWALLVDLRNAPVENREVNEVIKKIDAIERATAEKHAIEEAARITGKQRLLVVATNVAEHGSENAAAKEQLTAEKVVVDGDVRIVEDERLDVVNACAEVEANVMEGRQLAEQRAAAELDGKIGNHERLTGEREDAEEDGPRADNERSSTLRIAAAEASRIAEEVRLVVGRTLVDRATKLSEKERIGRAIDEESRKSITHLRLAAEDAGGDDVATLSQERWSAVASAAEESMRHSDNNWLAYMTSVAEEVARSATDDRLAAEYASKGVARVSERQYQPMVMGIGGNTSRASGEVSLATKRVAAGLGSDEASAKVQLTAAKVVVDGAARIAEEEESITMKTTAEVKAHVLEEHRLTVERAAAELAWKILNEKRLQAERKNVDEAPHGAEHERSSAVSVAAVEASRIAEEVRSVVDRTVVERAAKLAEKERLKRIIDEESNRFVAHKWLTADVFGDDVATLSQEHWSAAQCSAAKESAMHADDNWLAYMTSVAEEVARRVKEESVATEHCANGAQQASRVKRLAMVKGVAANTYLAVKEVSLATRGLPAEEVEKRADDMWVAFEAAVAEEVARSANRECLAAEYAANGPQRVSERQYLKMVHGVAASTYSAAKEASLGTGWALAEEAVKEADDKLLAFEAAVAGEVASGANEERLTSEHAANEARRVSERHCLLTMAQGNAADIFCSAEDESLAMKGVAAVQFRAKRGNEKWLAIETAATDENARGAKEDRPAAEYQSDKDQDRLMDAGAHCSATENVADEVALTAKIKRLAVEYGTGKAFDTEVAADVADAERLAMEMSVADANPRAVAEQEWRAAKQAAAERAANLAWERVRAAERASIEKDNRVTWKKTVLAAESTAVRARQEDRHQPVRDRVVARKGALVPQDSCLVADKAANEDVSRDVVAKRPTERLGAIDKIVSKISQVLDKFVDERLPSASKKVWTTFVVEALRQLIDVGWNPSVTFVARLILVLGGSDCEEFRFANALLQATCAANGVSVVFLLDQSHSMTLDAFQGQLIPATRAVAEGIRKQHVAGNVLWGAVAYGPVEVIGDIDEMTNDFKAFSTALSKHRFKGEETPTDEAFLVALRLFLASPCQSHRRIIFNFTDGRPNSPLKTKEAVAMMKSQDIIIVGVGLGEDIKEETLRSISSAGLSFRLKHPSQLRHFASQGFNWLRLALARSEGSGDKLMESVEHLSKAGGREFLQATPAAKSRKPTATTRVKLVPTRSLSPKNDSMLCASHPLHLFSINDSGT